MAHRRNRFDLLVVAKPDSLMDPKDQLLIDQFVMNGGRVLWLIDPIQTDLDSLAKNQVTQGVTRDLGLYDLLYAYGARLNRNLVIDPQCAPIVLDAGPNGNQRQYEMFSWYFAPIALPQGISHPITTNLDPIHFDFVSRVDTVGGEGEVKKTVLLASSERAREYKAPVRVASSIVELPPEYFNTSNLPHQPFAVLLEGAFQSAFSDRIPDVLRNDPDFAFRERSERTAQIVVGDIARNKVVVDGQGRPQIVPLGYDRYAQQVIYDNKEFLLNAISYLLDEQASISVRSRTINLRPLDRERIRTGRLTWQGVAVALPLLVVALVGRLFTAIRRRRFGKPSSMNLTR
jgi:ABC-2 type transport system permease protein